MDGGKSGYGAIVHAMAMKIEEEVKVEQTDDKVDETASVDEIKEVEAEEKTNHPPPTPRNHSNDKPKDELYRSLAITRSKICKRNVVSHEVSAGKLG